MYIYGYRLREEQMETLQSLVADNVVLKMFCPQEPYDLKHTLFVVRDFIAAQELAKYSQMQDASVLLWDELENVLAAYAWSAYCNSEWHYLQLALETARKPTVNTVLLGSSYAKYGLSARQMGAECVNLGLDAQDIYYSCKLGKLVIQNNPNIRNIVLASGYYWFFSDISRADTAYARGLITDTYYPIFQDAHHANGLIGSMPQSYLPADLNFLDEDKTITHYCRLVYQQQQGESAKLLKYFAYDLINRSWKLNNRVSRTGVDEVQPGELPWYMLPAQVKDAYAVERCKSHNKLLRHMESYEENKETLNQFVSLCNKKAIQVYILCMPQTVDYLRHLSPAFKERYFAALDSIDGEYQFLDFHEADIFQHQDFLDQDHLGPKGAEKATMFLKELLDSCKE